MRKRRRRREISGGAARGSEGPTEKGDGKPLLKCSKWP
jgi:hypothetical protein